MNNQESTTESPQEKAQEMDANEDIKKFVNPFVSNNTQSKEAEMEETGERKITEDAKPGNTESRGLKEKLNPTTIFVCIAIALCLVVAGVTTFKFNNPQRAAEKSAIEALKAKLDDTSSFKVIATSKPDSVFGRDYISDQEKMSINSAMMKVNDRVMGLTNNLENFDMENSEASALMEKQMNTAASIRSLMHASIVQNKVRKFSGWKVKVEYETTDKGNKIHSEYWAILDPSGKHVLFSFEIPIV